jgi:hypothetical protein
MRLQRRSDVRAYEQAMEQHRERVALHERHVESIHAFNEKNKQRAETAHKDAMKVHEHVLASREEGVTTREKLKKMISRLISRLPADDGRLETRAPDFTLPEPKAPEPVEIAVVKPPPPPEPPPEPPVFEANQYVEEEGADLSERERTGYTMIGPIRVLPGQWVLEAPDGALFAVTPEDIERHYQRP